MLLVGAGPVAGPKLEGLLAAGARVKVVAPEVRPEIDAAAVAIERAASGRATSTASGS